MSERRFVIKEVDDREAIFHPYEIAINESELRQRAVLMFNAKWTCKEDIRIDILLHGEGDLPPKEMRAEPYYKKARRGEKGEEPLCPFCGYNHPSSTTCKDWRELCPDCGRFNAVGVRCNCVNQPSPAPTREEWEAWAEAIAWTIVVHPTSEKRLKEVLLSMPCVAKEK